MFPHPPPEFAAVASSWVPIAIGAGSTVAALLIVVIVGYVRFLRDRGRGRI